MIHNTRLTRQDKTRIIQEQDKENEYQYPYQKKDFDYSKLSDREIDNLFYCVVAIQQQKRTI